MEPKYPGLVERYVNLGDCYDRAGLQPLRQERAQHAREHVARAGLGERGRAPVHDLDGAVGRGDEGHGAFEGHNGAIGLGERAGQGRRRGVGGRQRGAACGGEGARGLREGAARSAGGRVLGLTAVAPTLEEAVARAYAASERVSFEGMHKRLDIGARALQGPGGAGAC